VIASKRLTRELKYLAILNRLAGVRKACDAAQRNLADGSRSATQRAIASLESSASYIGDVLPGAASKIIKADEAENFQAECRKTAERVHSLITHLRENLLPKATLSDSPALGRESYARKLKTYTDSDLTPERLADMALAEIRGVRKIIAEVAEEYWREAHPEEDIPADPLELIRKAFSDMEKDRPASRRELLELFTRFANEAERFVRLKEIITPPADRTLSIRLAPASSGPAQRIGWVDVPAPFDPEQTTTLFLPNIEDDAPEKEKEDFYSSFNNHFNKFIIIHELFPGHYIQGKMTAGNPHRARIIFPYDPYIEGWATLCERVALDAGWDDYDKLTRLAQLRKRIENANRAYTSVMVHCFGWDETKVYEFSVTESLVAPQFAKSLYGRLLRAPMQMTSYFYGNVEFTKVYEAEMSRLGDKFIIRNFMDTILREGPIPLDEFPAILANE